MADQNTPAPADLVEAICRAEAKADGLDWDEVCGCETDAEECDSSTCIAAWDEDHNADLCRSHYRHRAQAAIAAMQAYMASDGVDRTKVEVPTPDNMDGMAWAKAFVAMRFQPHEIDEGLMVGWFANAIMAGYDTAHRRAAAITPQSDPRDQVIAELREALRFALKMLKPWVNGSAQIETMEATLAKSEGQ